MHKGYGFSYGLIQIIYFNPSIKSSGTNSFKSVINTLYSDLSSPINTMSYVTDESVTYNKDYLHHECIGKMKSIAHSYKQYEYIKYIKDE